MQIVVDTETGLILREANAALDTFHEWVELDTSTELTDELFTWRDSDRLSQRYG